VKDHLVLRYGFDVAGLRNIFLHVMAPNATAIRAYRQAGFQDIGIRRNSEFWDGAPCDELYMDAVPAGDRDG